jgi:CBS domain containing-hemolysin-like protein
VSFVPESLPVDRLLDTLHREGTHLAIAMDEHGGTAGLVTLADVLDEILGDVETAADVHRAASGEVRARGEARLSEVGELLDRELEHDEVDTVSGLVLDLLGRPPLVGDRVTHRGVTFEVVAVAGRGVAEVLITTARP